MKTVSPARRAAKTGAQREAKRLASGRAIVGPTKVMQHIPDDMRARA